MAKKEIAEVETKNTAIAALFGGGKSLNMADFEGEPTGFEGIDADDIQIPVINLTQPTSKESMKKHGIGVGVVFNSITGEAYPDGVCIVPVRSIKEYVEMIPYDLGGGFVATHDPASPFILSLTGGKKVFGRIQTPDGTVKGEGPKAQKFPTEVTETNTLFVIVINPADKHSTPQRAIIRFSSRKMRAFRELMGKAMTCSYIKGDGSRGTAPLYSHAYMLKAVEDGDYYGYAVSFAGGKPAESEVPMDIYLMGLEFNKQIAGGEVQTPGYEDDADVVAEQVGDYAHGQTPAYEGDGEKF